ncbi:concanavalin A-like lectin/glucanase domain-containing protein [Spinellus fusiger]|nr:concanavalin A-like lectin/glucanase domain-containing protein [Spinellus fusiger]
MGSYEGFYTAVIVCILVLASIVCCLGIRLFRRTSKNTSHEPHPTSNEWQPLNDITRGLLDDDLREQAQHVLAWQSRHPPRTMEWMDVLHHPLVIERGVDAWTFVESERLEAAEEESNVAVMDKTTLVFCHGQGCTLTNLPLPKREFVYWEVKILQLQEQEVLSIGLATKPYPAWVLPGHYSHSVAYQSHTGAVYTSDPCTGKPYGPPFKQGDVVGVGFLCRTSTLFFTRNGKNLGKACIGFAFPCYPAIGAKGPCQVSVNFGQQDFLFSAANQREAALAPKQGTLLPPPPYSGHTRDTMLFHATDDTNDVPHLLYTQTDLPAPPPPCYSSSMH